MEITVEGSAAGVEPLTSNRIEVTISDADAGSILSVIDAQEAVNHYGISTLLDIIGHDEAVAHFEIEEKE